MKYFEAKIWMRVTPGKNDLSMFVNEQPEGGLEWTFKDYDPEDEENFQPLYVHNFNLIDITEVDSEINKLRAQNEKLVEVVKEASLLLSSSSYLVNISSDWHDKLDEIFI